MSEESIHDIIREMMNCTAVKSKVPHSTVEDILNPPIIHFNLEQRTIVRDFAYRIAAAEERRKTTEPEKNSGNAAAMREALEQAKRDHWFDMSPDLRNKIFAALSAPPRNCDVGTTPDELAALPFNPVYAEVRLAPANGEGETPTGKGVGR